MRSDAQRHLLLLYVLVVALLADGCTMGPDAFDALQAEIKMKANDLAARWAPAAGAAAGAAAAAAAVAAATAASVARRRCSCTSCEAHARPPSRPACEPGGL